MRFLFAVIIAALVSSTIYNIVASTELSINDKVASTAFIIMICIAGMVEVCIRKIRAEAEKTRRMLFRAHFDTLTDPEIEELYKSWSKHNFVNHQ